MQFRLTAIEFRLLLAEGQCLKCSAPAGSTPASAASAPAGRVTAQRPSSCQLTVSPLGHVAPPATNGAEDRELQGSAGALQPTNPPLGCPGERLPDYLKPVRKGGPGPEVFILWRNVLRLAGELRIEGPTPTQRPGGPAGTRQRDAGDHARTGGRAGRATYPADTPERPDKMNIAAPALHAMLTEAAATVTSTADDALAKSTDADSELL